jgi:hypothetical protein
MSLVHFWTIVGVVSAGAVATLGLNPSTFMRAFGRFEVMYFVLLLFFSLMSVIALIMMGLQPR